MDLIYNCTLECMFSDTSMKIYTIIFIRDCSTISRTFWVSALFQFQNCFCFTLNMHGNCLYCQFRFWTGENWWNCACLAWHHSKSLSCINVLGPNLSMYICQNIFKLKGKHFQYYFEMKEEFLLNILIAIATILISLVLAFISCIYHVHDISIFFRFNQ